MVIFHSYVKLPEGIRFSTSVSETTKLRLLLRCPFLRGFPFSGSARGLTTWCFRWVWSLGIMMDCDNSKSLILDVAILCDVLKTAILSDFLGINIGHIWNNNGFPMLPRRNVFKLLGLDTQMTGTTPAIPPGKSSSCDVLLLFEKHDVQLNQPNERLTKMIQSLFWRFCF